MSSWRKEGMEIKVEWCQKPAVQQKTKEEDGVYIIIIIIIIIIINAYD